MVKAEAAPPEVKCRLCPGLEKIVDVNRDTLDDPLPLYPCRHIRRSDTVSSFSTFNWLFVLKIGSTGTTNERACGVHRSTTQDPPVCLLL